MATIAANRPQPSSERNLLHERFEARIAARRSSSNGLTLIKAIS